MSSRSVFVLGVTGYIGGSVLATSWVKRYPHLTFTTLIRNSKDAAAVQVMGTNVKIAIGDHSDLDLVTKYAREHDVVVNFASADDLALTQAILKGMLERAKSGEGTVKPVLLHTSGSGVAADVPSGKFIESTPIRNDNVVDDIKSIPDWAPHRSLDNAIFAASETGEIDTYIIAPSVIYGRGRGPVRFISQQVNTLIKVALRRKEYVEIGDGTNQWESVHIDELVELYDLVFDLALSGKNTNKSYANFFWGSTRTHAWKDINEKVAILMFKRGLLDTDKVKSVTLEEEPEVIVGSPNSRTVANRGFALGWKPKGTRLITDEDILEDEINMTVAQNES